MAAAVVEPVEGRQGHYAGAVSRLVAFGADVGASWGLFTLGAAALAFTIQLASGTKFSLSQPSARLADRRGDLGVPLLRLPVDPERKDHRDGRSRDPGGQDRRRAHRGPLRRSSGPLTLPLSIIVFGLGFLGILTNRRRYAWHDRFAKTAVVYSWDARAARLRWLARQDGTAPSWRRPVLDRQAAPWAWPVCEGVR